MRAKSQKTNKSPADYPKTSVRIPAHLMSRMKALRSRNETLTFGRMIVEALIERLPVMEERHGIKRAA